MIDAVDRGLAFRRQAGDDQRDGGAQIRRHDRRALQLADALDDCRLARQRDVCAEPGKLLHMHEAVLEDGLGDARLAFGHRHQAHELGLQIGREAGERLGGHVHRRDARAVAPDADAGIGRRDLGAGPAHHVERGLQEVWLRAFEQHVAAGHGDRHGVGAGLDAVGNDADIGARKLVHALYGDGGRAGAVDLRAHGDQAIGEVDDLGLARRVFQHGLAARQGRGHHQYMGGADRHFREHVAVAAQPVLRRRHDIAGVHVDLGAQLLQAVDEEIDRARADGATARQRDLGHAHAGEQRTDDPEGGAHLGDEFVGRGGVDDVGGGEVDGARIAAGAVLMAALAVDGIIDAMVAEDADELLDIGQMRHVLQRQRLRRQQRGDHQRQRRVLGPGNRNGARQLVAADDPDSIHEKVPAGDAPAFNRLSRHSPSRRRRAVQGTVFYPCSRPVQSSFRSRAAARPSGLASAAPARRERAWALRFIRLARNASASRALRSSAGLSCGSFLPFIRSFSTPEAASSIAKNMAPPCPRTGFHRLPQTPCACRSNMAEAPPSQAAVAQW